MKEAMSEVTRVVGPVSPCWAGEWTERPHPLWSKPWTAMPREARVGKSS